MTKVYVMEDDKFQSKEVNGAKANIHDHSKYSNKLLQEQVTRAIGVRECYTSIRKLYKNLKKKGIDIFTIADHDVIEGGLELRERRQKKGFDDSYISCEYTVPLEPEDYSQFIHVLCQGLDYPGDIKNPLPDRKVRYHHDMLKRYARLGRKEFYKACEGEGILYFPAHPALICTPKKPITGEQLWNIVTGDDIEDIEGPRHVEINTDVQLENLIAIDIAKRNNLMAKDNSKRKKLVLCCGTDAHTAGRLGDQYTVLWKWGDSKQVPVETSAEAIQALRKGNVGIGSGLVLPDNIENPSIADIIYYQFNGTIKNFQKDTLQGIWNYFLYEWGWRKALFMCAYLSIPTTASAICGHYLGSESILASAPVVLGLETLCTAIGVRGIPARGRLKAAKRTRKLYESYNKYLAYIDTIPQRNNIEKFEEEIKKLEEMIGAKQDEINNVYNSYANKELPIFNPKLRGFTNFSLGLVEKFFPGDYDVCDTEEFTEPIEEKED